jgi:hypothetical protein
LSPGAPWMVTSDPRLSASSPWSVDTGGMLAGVGRRCPDENRKILRSFSADPD